MKYSLFAFPAMLLLAATAAPAATVYTGTGGNIPDATVVPGVLIRTINVTDSYPVQSVVVTLTLNHSWVGDLIATLEHNGTTIDLFRRVRKRATNSDNGSSNNLEGAYSFDDNAGSRLVDAAVPGNTNFVLPAGTYRATTNLFNLNGNPTWSGEGAVSLNTTFGNMPVTGDWKLIISDNATLDRGRLVDWSLEVTSAGGVVPEPASLCGVAALLGCGVFFRNRRPAARG